MSPADGILQCFLDVLMSLKFLSDIWPKDVYIELSGFVGRKEQTFFLHGQQTPTPTVLWLGFPLSCTVSVLALEPLSCLAGRQWYLNI